MARPTKLPLDVTQSGWVLTLNTDFAKLLDTPFPIYVATDKATLDAINPKLYVNCYAIVATDDRMYRSNGTSWILYDAKLDYIADMNPGVSTIANIKDAYNSLLADMKSKGMMAVS